MSEDHDRIVDVLVRYARAVDTRDWALLRSCFTSDIVADYVDIGTWQSAEELTEFMIAAHAGMGASQHRLTNFDIEAAGSRASSVTYVHAVNMLASGPDDWIDSIGLYEDELTLGPDGWRIARRTFRTTRMIVSPSLTPPRPGGPSS